MRMQTPGNLLALSGDSLFQKIDTIIRQVQPANNFLLGGKLGLSLYHFSVYEALGNQSAGERAIQLLEEVLNQETGYPVPLAGMSFASGTSGLGYLITLLVKAGLIEMDLEQELKELDDSIVAEALLQIRNDHLDYLYGAMGAIHYFSLRADEPSIRQHLSVLIAAVADRAVKEEQGTWFPSYIVEEKDKDRIDLSLSHGNTGFLLILLNLAGKNILRDRIESIVTGGIRFILSSQMTPNPGTGQHTLFPFMIEVAERSATTYSERLAWCYGDLNILLLLYKASVVFNNSTWKSAADTIAQQVLLRKDESSTLAADAHFCHGTAGLVQVYQRLYDLSANESFLQARDHWMQYTLELTGKEMAANHYQNKEGDILTGWAGINLVLLSYGSKKSLSWTSALLL